MTDLTVWHDGDCPLCRREIAVIRRLDRRGAIRFVDASDGDASCPIDRRALLARFHTREDGRMLSGAAAFAAAMGAGGAGAGLSGVPRRAAGDAARGAALGKPKRKSAGMSVTCDPVLPGQESVWDYPRPAVAMATPRHIRIEHRGLTIADTRAAVRTLETSHPPGYYLPPTDIAMTMLRRSARQSFCEWKGEAVYYDLVIGDETIRDLAWSYPAPTPAFAMLRDHLAFYAAPLDRCLVDGEQVVPQPGGFYGGWITKDLAGPFKGVPGSRFW